MRGNKPDDGGHSLVEVRMRGPAIGHWAHLLTTRYDARVRLRLCRLVPGEPARLLRLMDVTTSPEKARATRRFLGAPPVGTAVTTVPITPQRTLVRILSPAPSMCLAAFEVGGICTSCPFLWPFSSEDSWNVLLEDRSDARSLVRAFAEPGGPPATIVGVGPCRLPGDLTVRQEAALETAYALGYFTQPRRAQLKQVAQALGVSRGRTSELIRRGTRKLIARREWDTPLPVVERA